MSELRYQHHQTRVIVIGGGASGVLLACHLLRDKDLDLEVTLIEKRPDVGRGVAYLTANPDHLLNVRAAANMSAFPDQPDHFCHWLCARQNRVPQQDNCADRYCFVPRNVYGEYIASPIAPLLGNETRPGRLRIIRGECISVTEIQSGVTVLGDRRRSGRPSSMLGIGQPH